MNRRPEVTTEMAPFLILTPREILANKLHTIRTEQISPFDLSLPYEGEEEEIFAITQLMRAGIEQVFPVLVRVSLLPQNSVRYEVISGNEVVAAMRRVHGQRTNIKVHCTTVYGYNDDEVELILNHLNSNAGQRISGKTLVGDPISQPQKPNDIVTKLEKLNGSLPKRDHGTGRIKKSTPTRLFTNNTRELWVGYIRKTPVIRKPTGNTVIKDSMTKNVAPSLESIPIKPIEDQLVTPVTTSAAELSNVPQKTAKTVSVPKFTRKTP